MKEDGRSVQGHGRGSLFSANFPPFNPLKEGPSESDIVRAKLIKEELLKDQRGAISPGDLALMGGVSFFSAALGAGIAILVDKVFADEPIDIGSVPGLTNSEVPQLQGLPPHLQSIGQPSAEPDTNKVNPKEVFDNTKESQVITPEMIERLPQVEIDRLYPTAFGKLREDSRETLVVTPQTNNLLQEKDRFPDKVTIIRDDGGILQLQYILDVSESKDPNAVVRIVKNIDGSIRFFNVPDGTTILSPNDGFLIVQRSDIPDDARPSNGDADTYDVLIDFVGMGNQYRIGIVGSTTAKGGKPGYEQTAFVFKNLTPASITSLNELKEYNAKPIGTYGIKIKRGDPLLKVVDSSRNKSPVEVGIKIFSALKITDDQKARPIRNPFVQAEIEFLTLNGTFLLPQKKPVD